MAAALFMGCGNGDASPNGTGGTGAATGSAGATTGGAGGGSATGGSGGDGCGQCAPAPALGWTDPVLVWLGAEANAPVCPSGAPAVAYEGHADLSADLNCATCTCDAPIGSCSLPATLTANAATCALDGPSTTHTSFDPAPGWTGSCDNQNPIPSGKLCSGVHCVQSISVAALGLSESTCVPHPAQQPAQGAPAWQTFGRACQAVPHTACDGGAGMCLAASPPGFRVCMFQAGDQDCPAFTPYSDKHVFYASFDDTRACSTCSCDTPAGSSCSASVSVFTDGACSTLAATIGASAAGPTCHDLPSGAPLGSKSATTPAYTPGACNPVGGSASGAATPSQPSTLCCLPP